MRVHLEHESALYQTDHSMGMKPFILLPLKLFIGCMRDLEHESALGT